MNLVRVSVDGAERVNTEEQLKQELIRVKKIVVLTKREIKTMLERPHKFKNEVETRAKVIYLLKKLEEV